jgi:hypothetical protein
MSIDKVYITMEWTGDDSKITHVFTSKEKYDKYMDHMKEWCNVDTPPLYGYEYNVENSIGYEKGYIVYININYKDCSNYIEDKIIWDISYNIIPITSIDYEYYNIKNFFHITNEYISINLKINKNQLMFGELMDYKIKLENFKDKLNSVKEYDTVEKIQEWEVILKEIFKDMIKPEIIKDFRDKK